MKEGRKEERMEGKRRGQMHNSSLTVDIAPRRRRGKRVEAKKEIERRGRKAGGKGGVREGGER